LVTKSSWDKIVVKKSITDNIHLTLEERKADKSNKLNFIMITPPEKFKSFSKTTIMGADFETRLLYKVYTNLYETTFLPSKDITKFRYTTHTNGKRLTLVSMQPKPFSISQGEKSYIFNGDEFPISTTQHYVNTCMKHIPEESETLLITNNKLFEKEVDNTKIRMLDIEDSVEKISMINMGENKYSHYNYGIIIAACNASPDEKNTLGLLGLSTEDIDNDRMFSNAYQTMCRSSLRDPNATDDVVWFVADDKTRDALAKKFPGCKVKSLPPSSPVTYNRNESRDQKALETKIEKMITKADDKVEKNYINMQVNLYEAMYSTKPFDNCLRTPFSVDEFLRTKQDKIINGKSDNNLFNATIWKDDIILKGRNKENVLGATAVILDIDDGDMSNEVCYEILKSNNIAFTLYSTAGADLMHDKYRVIVYVNEFMDIEAHSKCFDYLLSLIEKNGYYTLPLNGTTKKKEEILSKYPNAKFSGIDMSKKGLQSFFYLPATVKGKEEFVTHKSNGLSSKAKLASTVMKVSEIIKLDIKLLEEFQDEVKVYTKTEYVSSSNTDFKETHSYKNVLKLVDSLTRGERSYNTCRIGGIIKEWDLTHKIDIYNMVSMKGADKAALQSFKKYANM
jgi:hypothetical protein